MAGEENLRFKAIRMEKIGLLSVMDMDNEDIMLNSDNGRRLLDRARRYCAVEERCPYDVRRKLTEWGADEGEKDAVVTRLEADGYLDEGRYARAYCESKMLRGGWGRQKVRYELRQKGVSREAIEEGVASVPQEEYMAALRRQVEKRLGEGVLELDDKTKAYLLRRGYGWGEMGKLDVDN